MKKVSVSLIFPLLLISFLGMAQQKGARNKNAKNAESKRFAICIGIGRYDDDRLPPLIKARNDAWGVSEVLKKYGRFDRVIRMTHDLELRNKNYPNRVNVIQRMKYLSLFIEPNDLVLFFFSGYGFADSTGKNYLLMVDSTIDDLEKTGLAVDKIVAWLKELEIRRSIFIFDASRKIARQIQRTKLWPFQIESYNNREVGARLYSTKDGGYSVEGSHKYYNVFTRLVMQGMLGMADQSVKNGGSDNHVSLPELAAYVEKEFAAWSSVHGVLQKPYFDIKTDTIGIVPLSSYALPIESLPNPQMSDAPPPIRSTYAVVPRETLKTMLKKKKLFELHLNKTGDYPNKYQTKILQGVKVIIDSASGLMWQHSVPTFTDGSMNFQFTFKEAKQWIRKINRDKMAGFSDWRLPTLEEAVTLLEKNKENGRTYVASVFSEKINFIFTGDTDFAQSHWVVLINNGSIMLDSINGIFEVLPVRSIQSGVLDE